MFVGLQGQSRLGSSSAGNSGIGWETAGAYLNALLYILMNEWMNEWMEGCQNRLRLSLSWWMIVLTSKSPFLFWWSHLFDKCVSSYIIEFSVGRMKWSGHSMYICDKVCLTCSCTFTRSINTLSEVSHAQGAQTLAKLTTRLFYNSTILNVSLMHLVCVCFLKPDHLLKPWANANRHVCNMGYHSCDIL